MTYMTNFNFFEGICEKITFYPTILKLYDLYYFSKYFVFCGTFFDANNFQFHTFYSHIFLNS